MKIKVGDKVMWRGGFGLDAPMVAVITEIEVCKAPRSKHGISVSETDWSLRNLLVVSLENGCWAYGSQISPIQS